MDGVWVDSATVSVAQSTQSAKGTAMPRDGD
jgi:hypothetical protein